MSKFRKAVAAGAAAGVGVLAAGLVAEVPRTQAGWGALLGGAAGTAVAAAYATYRVPNATR